MIGPLSGYLLASPTHTEVSRRDVVSKGNGRVSTEFVSPFEGLNFWERYKFVSDKPFPDDDGNNTSKPPYEYDVYCARSGAKLIILTEKKRLTDYVITEILNKEVFPNLKHVSFQLDNMIEIMQDLEGPYRITSLHGRFAGASRDLRTMILYGPQVTNSAVFKEQSHLFNFYICGVAERSPDDPFFIGDYGEIARIGNDGSISVQSFNRKRAADLNKLVNHLISSGWVDDWVIARG